jgi:hypothetical protein
VVLNFSATPLDYTLPAGTKVRKLLLANVPGTEEPEATRLHLGAWDARVYSY